MKHTNRLIFPELAAIFEAVLSSDRAFHTSGHALWPFFFFTFQIKSMNNDVLVTQQNAPKVCQSAFLNSKHQYPCMV